ncbi:MAG: class I SAM-dependent methyltransferase [Microcystaceae cyanobacterium]
MQSSSNFNQGLPLPDNISKTAYQVLQDVKAGLSLAHKSISSQIGEFFVERPEKPVPLSADIIDKLKQRRQELLEIDWQEAKAGIYPEYLLFETNLNELVSSYPLICLDLPKIWQRLQQDEYQSFDPEIDQEGYPRYYLRNFHYQTNGYLSDESAQIYDLQVDILFSCVTDAMRRRILKPIKEKLAFFDTDSPRILDVACGTGRSLKLIRAMLPKASLYGLDLSPAYLKKANQILSQNYGDLPQLIQGNGESLPFVEDYFQGVVSVFLFHELPPTARQKVIDECYRVIQPGGVFVICDSMQKLDSPEFEAMMQNFSSTFHEPYYNDYIGDDLGERLTQAGFIDLEIQNHFASKYWIVRKPA